MKSHYSFSTYKHHQQRQYTFKVYRKNAIINVQIKPNSGHDPKILRGIFTGFLQHALTFCSQQHEQEEIDFLVQKFVDNGDQKHELFRILNKFQRKTSNPPPTPSENTDQTQIVVLPWVPGLSNNHHRVWMDDFKILGSGYNSNFKRKISEAPVSYTHLTLPTIYSV